MALLPFAFSQLLSIYFRFSPQRPFDLLQWRNRPWSKLVPPLRPTKVACVADLEMTFHRVDEQLHLHAVIKCKKWKLSTRPSCLLGQNKYDLENKKEIMIPLYWGSFSRGLR